MEICTNHDYDVCHEGYCPACEEKSRREEAEELLEDKNNKIDELEEKVQSLEAQIANLTKDE